MTRRSFAKRQRLCDLLAALSGKPARKRIAKKRIWAFVLTRAINCGKQGGVGDVAD